MRQIHIVAAVREDGVPPPDSNHPSHGHGQHNEKVFIGKRDQQCVDMQLTSQPLQQRSVLVKQEHGYESTGHRQQCEHKAYAQIYALRIRVAATAKDALYEELNQPPKRALMAFSSTFGKSHAALITPTMSLATRIVSTSSTRWRNVFSRDAPRIFPMFATESCAMTVPLRRIRTSVQTFSTTSSTCEQ